jgi:uncharacterized protein (TIGR02147 family)
MINIFDYTDFRKFLTDYYDDQKKYDRRFSLRSLTAQCGINAGNFVKMLKGERNFTAEGSIKLSSVLKLTKRERDYFQAMIRFCQARSHNSKKIHFEEMMSFKESTVRTIDANHYIFYDKWYYTAVREALAFFPLTDKNFAELGKCIIPSITERQVAKAVNLLTDLNLIVKDETGQYHRTDTLLSTGNNVKSLILNNFVINTMKLAAEAINSGMKGTNLSSVTISISELEFQKIQDEIRQCRQKVMDIAKNSVAPDRVMQLNVQLFPLTEQYNGAGV